MINFQNVRHLFITRYQLDSCGMVLRVGEIITLPCPRVNHNGFKHVTMIYWDHSNLNQWGDIIQTNNTLVYRDLFPN